MKPAERFITALKRGIPDRVPIFEFPFSQKLQEELIGYRTELYNGAAIAKVSQELGLDAIPVFMGGYCGFDFFGSEDDTFTDDWGITYIKKGWPIRSQISSPIKDRKDWKKYIMPDPMESWRLKQIEDSVEANKKGLAIVVGLRGPVSMLSWFLMDIQSLSIALYEDPGVVSDINHDLVQWNLQAAREVVRNIKVDAFLVADDWGSTKGLLLSPGHLRKHFLRPYGELVRGLKELGLPVIMHNDGNIWEMLEELVDTGIDAYHPVEKMAGMDLARVKQKYGQRICPIGNVNNKTVLVSGTAEEVKAETISCLKSGSPDGGYIISSDHSIHDDIPIENVTTFIRTAKQFGVYSGRELRSQ